jgi:NAD(P)H dehydrogenase (quinone)
LLARSPRPPSATFTYHPETLPEAFVSRAPLGVPDWQVRAWLSTYAAIAAGELAGVTDAVERLTGHRAASLAELMRQNPAL